MKKLFLMTMLAMLALTSQAQEKYHKDSLYKVVYASFKEDSTYKGDGGIKYLETAEQAIKNKHFANRFMADFLMQLCFDSRFGRFSDCKDYVDKFMSYCKEDSLCQKINAAYAKFYKEFSPVFPGKPAPDFTFYDTKGKIHKLSELKGKMLFIDIWGTWCGPCIEEIPYLKALQEKYGNDKRIQIMSIACDKTDPKWKAFLEKRKADMTWSQYRVTIEGDKILDDVYHVDGIPRLMLIDKNGNIISADTIRPSWKEFEPWLKEQLNKY